VGCFKGNIATQVGDLYGPNDPRRADAFQIYFIGIQIAVIFAPIACRTLALNHYNWHWGFALAGVGMLIGLTIYLFGRPTFPPEPLDTSQGEPGRAPPLDRRDITSIVVLDRRSFPCWRWRASATSRSSIPISSGARRRSI
jgi:POT family proton-dependent oligopeptide transporter